MYVHASPAALLMVLASFSEGMFALCAPAPVSEVSTREDAMRAAEAFIAANHLHTQRTCPAEQLAKDAARGYEVTPICPYYEASDSRAYRAVSLDEHGWRVYFRKASHKGENNEPVFRVVDVYSPIAGDAHGKVCLRDLEDSQ